MAEIYYDKNKKEIKDGMMLRHEDGTLHKVYASDDGELGFNATNENWAGWDGLTREIYPLHQFSLKEYTVVDIYGCEEDIEYAFINNGMKIEITVRNKTANIIKTAIYQCIYTPIFGYDISDLENVNKLVDEMIEELKA